MIKVAIISGSTRPGRKSQAVAEWVHAIAQKRGDADYQIVDIATFNLPLLDEPVPPSLGKYSKPHTLAWAKAIAPFDAFVFVTPEYNHGPSAALKNAIDYLYHEWNNKAAGFVSYGSTGGARAVEHLRGIMAEVQVADVRAHVSMSMYTDFENWSVLKPDPRHQQQLGVMLDQLVAWSRAMQGVRADKKAIAA